MLSSCASPSLAVRAEPEGLGTEDAAIDRREISFPVLAPHDKPGLQATLKPPFNRFRRNTPRERCLRAQSANRGDVQSRRPRVCVGELPKRPPPGGKRAKEASGCQFRAERGLAGVFPPPRSTVPTFRVAAFKVLPAKAALGFRSPPPLQGPNPGILVVAWDATRRQTGEAENGAPLTLSLGGHRLFQASSSESGRSRSSQGGPLRAGSNPD